jgi:hypothetical protein
MSEPEYIFEHIVGTERIAGTYTPPKPATPEIAALHDEFHARGRLIGTARAAGDHVEEARLDAINMALAERIKALSAEAGEG